MESRTDVGKLLVLRGPALEASGVLDFLSEHFEVCQANDLGDALSAMRHERFCAVLSETADFLPLERGVVTQQAAAVLDTIGDGVCMVDSAGGLSWANRSIREFSPEVLSKLCAICMRANREFRSSASRETYRGRRYTLIPDDRTYYEVICSPVRDPQGKLQQVAAVVVNATTQRRQQIKLNAIDRAGRELVHLESAQVLSMDATERLKLLEDRIISCSRDVLDYQHFAVLLLDEATNKLDIIISQGMGSEVDDYGCFARTEGNGICGYVAATGRSYICADVSKDPRYMGTHGAMSCMTVPLMLNDKVIGVLHIESDQIGRFGEEDRQFSEILANYVALASHILNLLVAARHTTHTKVTGSMAAEIAGPINDIITDLGDVLEDYIGMDDLRNRLNSIIDSASNARNLVRAWGKSPTSGMMGDTDKVAKDPVLAGKRVLVAEDEEIIRETVQGVLAQRGCIVDAAYDGGMAIEMLNSNPRYDLVVSDIKMPKSSGYDVFAAAKAKSEDTQVILMTAFGYDPNHAVVRANKEGLSAVLYKPFKVNQLVDQCRIAIQGES